MSLDQKALVLPEGLKMNYGCGSHYLEGFVNVDHSKSVRADLYGSLHHVYDTYGEKFAYVLLRHVFEHIDNQMQFMEQLYRVCVPGALVEVFCPYYSSVDAWSDPDHKRAISENTFVHFSRNSYFVREDGNTNPITPAHFDRYLPDCDFKAVVNECLMADRWVNKSQEEQEFARRHLCNAVKEYHVILECIKPARVHSA